MLHEEYRPKTWADFVGQERTIAAARSAVKAHWMKIEAGQAAGGFAVLVQGPSGTGKSTMATLLAAEFGAEKFDIMRLDGDKCTVEAVRDLEQAGGFLSTRPWNKAKAIIIDECHAMSSRAVQAWLTQLERLPRWCIVVFTTTEGMGKKEMFGNFASPFIRRCVSFTFATEGLELAFAKRVKEVAEREGLGGASDAEYLQLVIDCNRNLGLALSRVQAGVMVRTFDDVEASAPELQAAVGILEPEATPQAEPAPAGNVSAVIWKQKKTAPAASGKKTPASVEQAKQKLEAAVAGGQPPRTIAALRAVLTRVMKLAA